MITTYRMKTKRKGKRAYSKRCFYSGVAVIAVILTFLLILCGLLLCVHLFEAYASPVEEMTVETEVIETSPERFEAVAGEAKDETVVFSKAHLGAVAADEEDPKPQEFVILPVDMPEDEQRIVFEIANDNGIAFTFVMAIIGHESEFTKDARSTTGDSGYMQINDCNLEEMANRGFNDMFDTYDNVSAGVSILRDLFNTYGEDEVHKVLMAYNMGAGNAAKLWKKGVTTSEYSREIVALEKEYSAYIDAQRIGK